jgi:hypothetical protein
MQGPHQADCCRAIVQKALGSISTSRRPRTRASLKVAITDTGSVAAMSTPNTKAPSSSPMDYIMHPGGRYQCREQNADCRQNRMTAEFRRSCSPSSWNAASNNNGGSRAVKMSSLVRAKTHGKGMNASAIPTATKPTLDGRRSRFVSIATTAAIRRSSRQKMEVHGFFDPSSACMHSPCDAKLKDRSRGHRIAPSHIPSRS